MPNNLLSSPLVCRRKPALLCDPAAESPKTLRYRFAGSPYPGIPHPRPVPSVAVPDHQSRTLAALQSFTTVKFSKPLVLKTIRNAGGCGYGYPPSSGLKAILELPTSVPLRRGDTNRETNSTSPALPLCEISVRPGFSTLGDPPRSPCAPAGASRLALNGLGCASPLPRGDGHYQRRFCVKSSPQSKQFGKTGNPIPRCLGPGAEG